MNVDTESDDSSDGSVTDSDSEEYDTEDEAFPEVVPANLFSNGTQTDRGQALDVNLDDDMKSPLPLCLLLNARSVYNKCNNLTEMLHQIGPDICLVSETFERERLRLRDIFKSRIYKHISYYRKNRAPGGGCAIFYNEKKFSVLDLKIPAPSEVENIWAIFTPKEGSLSFGPNHNVKRIAVGSYYVSPRSRYQRETIGHIIDTICTLRAKYDNEVNFLIGGDFNRTEVTDILDCYGALHQIISVPTRNEATLEIILTDLHTLFHPPTTLPPLQVDSGKDGSDSDHETVVFAPKDNSQYRATLKKKTIKTRPLPQSGVLKFDYDLMTYPWDEVFMCKSVNEQVQIFHDVLRSSLEKHFPEKITKISALDKGWMSPQLKQLHRAMQREFYKNRGSLKHKRLKSKFKKLKRKSIKSVYSTFVSELKMTDPGRWYSMAKKIGAIKQTNDGDTKVESLSTFSNTELLNILHPFPMNTYQ